MLPLAAASVSGRECVQIVLARRQPALEARRLHIPTLLCAKRGFLEKLTIQERDSIKFGDLIGLKLATSLSPDEVE